MKGYPKHLNTKQDYEFVRKHFPKRKWEKDFQALLKSEKTWLPIKTLTEKDRVVIDDTHKTVETGDGVVQMELKIDKNSKMARLGYTREEIEQILSEKSH
jgi:16S rRNA C967 or C1407 C5-methylase (RsmB/RsmF family)